VSGLDLLAALRAGGMPLDARSVKRSFDQR